MRSVFQSWWRTYQRSSSIRSAHGNVGAAVDLRPAGDARLDVEPVQLALVVLLDLVAERRARPDHRHVAANDVPELRKLVDAQPPQQTARARDASIALVDGEAGPLLLGADHHRPQLQQLEVGPVAAHPGLAVEHRPAVLQLHRQRRDGEHRARDDESRAGDRHVERPVQTRVPSATSHVAGTPRRR